MLRPIQSRWFELLVEREKTLEVLDLLAGSGMIELEIDPRTNEPIEIRSIRKHIARYSGLAGKYSQYWPAPEIRKRAFDRPPLATLTRAVDLLEQWQLEADPLLEKIESQEREAANLELVLEFARAVDERQLDIRSLAGCRQTVNVEIHATPLPAAEPVCPEESISYSVDGTKHRFVVFLSLDEQGQARRLAGTAGHALCRPVTVPDDLRLCESDTADVVSARLHSLEQALLAARKALAGLEHKYELKDSLNDIALFNWYMSEHRCEPTADQAFCRITGWTIDQDGQVLQPLLEQAGVDTPIRYIDPPKTVVAPSVMSNPHWAQPFEMFIKMFGQPAGAEVDPSSLLAIIIPLLFGYMFPDVGHGGILVLVALLGKKHWPQIALLLPCGISAMLFGVFFGEVFGIEGVLDPLLFSVMERPLTVLIIPVYFGAGLLISGFLLSALSYYWKGRFSRWLAEDAGLFAIYIGILGYYFLPTMAWVAGGGVLWYVLGNLVSLRGQRGTGLPRVLGGLLQATFELLLNTISFVRIGAFALAHAALSLAVLSVASTQSHPVTYWFILLLGTVIMIVLEVIVVMAQTTRLVFFEFFSHFFKAEGRIFRPSSVIG